MHVIKKTDGPKPKWIKYPANKESPSGRYGHRAVQYKNKMIIHGGYNGKERLSDSWEYNIETHVWKKIDAKGNIPPARDCHSAVLYKDKMVIFAGGDGFKWLSDVYSLDLKTYIWEQITPKNSKQKKIPVRRNSVAATTFFFNPHTNGNILPVGAIHNFQSRFNTEPNLEETNRIQVQNQSNLPGEFSISENNPDLPEGRAGHSANVVEDKMYVFGGWNGKKTLNDIFEFDFLTSLWKKIIPFSSISPAPRDSHTGVVINKKKGFHDLDDYRLVIIGGGDGRRRLNDIHMFNFKKRLWEKCDNFLGQVRGGRAGHCCVKFESQENYWFLKNRLSNCLSDFQFKIEKLIIFGGGDGVNWLSDVFEFDINAKKWLMVEAKGDIAPGAYGLSAVVYKNRMLIFGGGDGKKWYNDVYEYEIEEEAPKRHMKFIMFNSLHAKEFVDCEFKFHEEKIIEKQTLGTEEKVALEKISMKNFKKDEPNYFLRHLLQQRRNSTSTMLKVVHKRNPMVMMEIDE